MMKRLLSGCILNGNLATETPDFAAVSAALQYQAQTLGITLQQGAIRDCSHLSFNLQTPQAGAITCRINRWQDDSVSVPVTETILQAAHGLMSVHGRATGQTQALGVNYVTTLTASLALQGAFAASLAQLRGLPIRQSNTSLSAAALLSIGQYLAGATAEELPEKLLPGQIAHADCPPFVSADGMVFELETLDAKPWQAFWADLGIDKQLAGKAWSAFLLRYAKAVAPLPTELIQAIAARDYSDIDALAKRYQVSICPLRTLQERAKDADCQRVFEQGAWTFDSTELRESIPQRKALRQDLPLNGLTVIESCRRIQGPLAGHLLSLLGAQVIRIEPIGGDPLRGMPPMADGVSERFAALNRHKSVREIDIKSPAGKEEIYALIREADVFLHNWAPGNAEKLQLSAAELQRLNPSLVYGYAAGWSTPDNVQDNLLGTDFVTQAYSGVAQQIARQSGKRGGSLFTVLDVLGGVVAAQGVTAALLARQLQPKQIRLTSSLASSAVLLTAAPLQRIYQPELTSTPSASLLNAVYPTQQGSIALECIDSDSVTRLLKALDLTIAADAADLSTAVGKALLDKTAQQCLSLLQAAQIPAVIVVEDLTDVLTNPLLQPCLSAGSYTHVTSPWSFS
jgi:CoA:oxalate CoA-transferase